MYFVNQMTFTEHMSKWLPANKRAEIYYPSLIQVSKIFGSYQMACKLERRSSLSHITLEDVRLPRPPEPPSDGSSTVVTGVCGYYHYDCDLTQDVGWGCGYRTLQTICSWIMSARKASREICSAPTIPYIQQTLVDLGDKPPEFFNSNEWIGSFEACLVIGKLFDIQCKILHVLTGADLYKYVPEIEKHFKFFGSPIMMGGDEDASSKGIFGTHVAADKTYLLVVDPHYKCGPTSIQTLFDGGFLTWQPLEEFSVDSFYNLCLPQFRHPSLVETSASSSQ